MPWGRLDDNFYDHPKLDKLGADRLPCIGLDTLAKSWCNRYLTDGYVPSARVERLGGTLKLADKLVAAELWEVVPGGYLIHDFLHYNDSREQVLAEREAARERRSKGGRTSGERNANVAPRSDDVQKSRPLRTVPIHSVPSDVQANVERRDPEVQRMLDLQAKALHERGLTG